MDKAPKNLAAYNAFEQKLKDEHEERFNNVVWNSFKLANIIFILLVVAYPLFIGDPRPEYESTITMLKIYSGIGSFTLFIAFALDSGYKLRKIFFLLGLTALTACVGTLLVMVLVRDKPLAYQGVVACGSLLVVSMTLWFLRHSHEI